MNACQLRTIYGEDYFHGVNSGYPKDGYEVSHPICSHWLEYVRRVRPTATRWLDIGCAYGYLVEEARQKGFQAFGIDISSYALQQEPSARSYLVESLAESLPFPDDAFDVISIFDVIEHLESPETVIRETVRLLRPGGICLGSTPDPLFFERKEETHISEYPPSYWVDLYRRHGMEIAFRFAGEPFNMEFVALLPAESLDPAGTDPALPAFQHDQLKFTEDIVKLAPDLRGRLYWAYRQGWDILEERNPGRRTARGPEASIYLLDADPTPFRLEVKVSVPPRDAAGSIRVQLDDRPLGSLHLDRIEESRDYDLEPFLVSSGGHHLRFMFPSDMKSFPISSLEISGREVTTEELTTSFPFDLYQRYQAVKQILENLFDPSSTPRGEVSVLDFGGVMGGTSGHMGSLGDFLPGWDVTVSDVRHCDIPSFMPLEEQALPGLPGDSEVIVCMDVLEHIPPGERSAFLDRLVELPNSWLILGCPCAGPAISRAEEALDEFIKCTTGYRHDFIREHLEYGLPDFRQIENELNSRDLPFVSIPNGTLHRWLIMQCVTFYISTLQSNRLLECINRFYNEEFYRQDNADPAYRKIFVVDVSKTGRLRDFDPTRLVSPEPEEQFDNWATKVLLFLQLLNLEGLNKKDQEIRRLDFLLKEREKHIEELLKHTRNLEATESNRQKHVENLQLENQDLRHHAQNLESERNDLRQHSRNLETAHTRLQSDFLQANETMIQREKTLGDLRESLTRLEHEKMESLRRINDLKVDRIDIQKQALEKETLLLARNKEIRRLEEALAETTAWGKRVQQELRALEAENVRLRELLAGKKIRDLWLLLREYVKRGVR